jgi:hypothetical protein
MLAQPLVELGSCTNCVGLAQLQKRIDVQMEKNKRKNLRNWERLLLQSSEEGERRKYRAALVSVGFLRAMGGRQSNRYVPAETLKAAVAAGLFEGLAVFVDHAGWFEYPKVERLVASTSNVVFEEETQRVTAEIVFYESQLANEMVNLFDAMLAEEKKPDVGFSLVFWGSYGEREEPDDPLVLESITHVESADIVFEPASDGARVIEALSTKFEIGHGVPVFEEEKEMPPNENYQANQEPVPATPEQVVSPDGAPFDVEAFRAGVLGAMDARLDAAMERFTQAIDDRLAAQEEDEAVQLGAQPPRSPNIVMGLNGYEELEQAARAMLAGENPPSGVRPLSGVRELYLLLSGDYEMTGRYHDERVQFAAVDSSTLANLFADALNKRVIEVGELFPKWWKPAVTIENFNTLQDAKWIVLGGVGELPTVAEGSAYTELTLDDQQESDSFVKKGGYLGVTLEAIDKDDTRKVQAIPRVLARAAWVTLGKAIAAIFTTASGVGPTMADSVVMFHSTSHGNLGTSDLSFTSWRDTRSAMMKITELNSGERLGPLNAPHLLWVPPDLEYTGLQILASMNEPGTADNDINPEVENDSQAAKLEAARNRLVLCPYWTDANNWMVQANPMLYPGLGLGYRFGESPEVFSVADPRAGLMFTNDVMPVKVRYFYAVGPIDWRPFYKHNVT